MPARGAALVGCPPAPVFEIMSAELRRFLLNRLRLSLLLVARSCEGCGRELDRRGFHRSACTRSGCIHRRAIPLERAMGRICREAGVKMSVTLKNLNVGVSATEKHQLEVVAQSFNYK